MQTFFKRLMQIVDNQGFKNLNDFALNGLKYESSSKLNRLKDEKNKPSIEILTDISNKFQNVNLDWLITGRGEMLQGCNLKTQEVAETIFGDEILVNKIDDMYNKINYMYSLSLKGEVSTQLESLKSIIEASEEKVKKSIE